MPLIHLVQVPKIIMSEELYFGVIPVERYPFIDCHIEQLDRIAGNLRDALQRVEHARKAAITLSILNSRLSNGQIVRCTTQSVKTTAAARYDSNETSMDLSTIPIVFFVDLVTYLPLPDIKALTKNDEALHKAAQLCASRPLDPRWSVYYTCLATINEEWAKKFLEGQISLACILFHKLTLHDQDIQPIIDKVGHPSTKSTYQISDSIHSVRQDIAQPNDSDQSGLCFPEVSTVSQSTEVINTIHSKDLLQATVAEENDLNKWPAVAQSKNTAGEGVNLAWIAQQESLLIKALKAKEKAWGVNDPTTLDTAVNLGCLYLNQRRLEEAEQLFMRALYGYEKLESSEHPKVQQIMGLLVDLHACQAG